MKDLLTRLQKCDPATWKRFQDIVFDLEGFTTENAMLVQDAILQACLQEAIAANHWWLEQSTFTAQPSAKIQKSTDATWKDYSAQADTPAHALLAAYIEAKEAAPRDMRIQAAVQYAEENKTRDRY